MLTISGYGDITETVGMLEMNDKSRIYLFRTKNVLWVMLKISFIVSILPNVRMLPLHDTS